MIYERILKMTNLTIRLETGKDYRAVEELTREAFWNVYKPGADEHYYVHHMHVIMFICTRLIDIPKSITGKFFYCSVVFFGF